MPTTWANTATGELVEGECPYCAATREEAEVQMRAMEMERRKDRATVTRLRNEMEAAKVAKRDASVWAELLGCWQLAFPDKRPTATGVKSARATAVFQRLDSGAEAEDIKNAIAGAMRYPYVVFGKRRETGSTSDRADDLQEIMSVNNDAQFDFLVAVGREAREAQRA